VLVDWSDEFETWLNRHESRAESGDRKARLLVDLVTAQLLELQELAGEPSMETATLKQVRQSGKHQVWRVAHPFVVGIAVRLIVWFPPQEPNTVVIVLFAGDKAKMGDVFYASVATRADTAIDTYRRHANDNPLKHREGGISP
jgi:hypothetical protein